MKDRTELQEETHEVVGRYLEELFDNPLDDEESGSYFVGYGSTVLEISVEPYGPEDTVVKVTAYCAQGVRKEEDLLLGLLELNHELPIGAFSLVEDDIYLSQSLFGRELGRKNLLGAIAAIATVADDYDDRIVARYGGQTAGDRIQVSGGRRRTRPKS